MKDFLQESSHPSPPILPPLTPKLSNSDDSLTTGQHLVDPGLFQEMAGHRKPSSLSSFEMSPNYSLAPLQLTKDGQMYWKTSESPSLH